MASVNWHEAQGFAEWLSYESPDLSLYRLPTEAEWEYACRAGTKTIYFWGNASEEACKYANVGDKTARTMWHDWSVHNCNDGYAVSSPVGSFQPNGFGLYDILGNVWEWCEDRYAKNAYQIHTRRNPLYDGPTGSRRVTRGGSWSSKPGSARSAYRYFLLPETRDSNLGFRLVRTE